MKLLLLGGNGQVGRELRRSLAPLGTVVVGTRDGGAGEAIAEALDKTLGRRGRAIFLHIPTNLPTARHILRLD